MLTTQKISIQRAIELKKEELPHLYYCGDGSWYPWALEFFNSRNKMNLLVAANQISKSSTAIRKNIEWACNKALWPVLWDAEPRQFWYFYPTLSTATSEVISKWIPEFLPRGSMRDHELYGWELQMSQGDVDSIHFRSGVSIRFRTYSMKPENLQTSTVSMVTGDEEMPADLADECVARLFATAGYFNLVFTATVGQELWYRAMEMQGKPEETYKSAKKWNISMYDCLKYVGTDRPTPWTVEKIKAREDMCSTDNERLRRVMGRFVRDEGLRYPSFSSETNVHGDNLIPEGWRVYAAVDVGSGRTSTRRTASNAAIVAVAVSKDSTQAKIVRSWRGDNVETSSTDVLKRYLELTRGVAVVSKVYDFGSKDFGLIAERAGHPFQMADKDKTRGEGLLNMLFKACALSISPIDCDNQKLITELMSTPVEKSRHNSDDLSDALKYCVMSVPWDYQRILASMPGVDKAAFTLYPEKQARVLADAPDPSWTPAQYAAWEIDYRRSLFKPAGSAGEATLSDEITVWNEAYG